MYQLGGNSNYSHVLKNRNIVFYQEDLLNSFFLRTFLEEHPIDLIVHCAAQTTVTKSIIDPRSDFYTNAIGSFNLLDSVRKSGSDPTLILMSSNKIYGENFNDLSVIEKEYRYEYPSKDMRIWESFPIDQTRHSPYGTSKLCADLYFQEYAKTYDLKTGIFRCSCIYGPYQNGCEDQGWIVHFILSALQDKKINIFGSGKQVRDILYIDDLIQAFDKFYKCSSNLKGEVFNIGGGKDNTLSLLELIDLLESELETKIKVEFQKERLGDQKVYVSDTRKALEKFGWKPETDKIIGLYKTIQFYKEQFYKEQVKEVKQCQEK